MSIEPGVSPIDSTTVDGVRRVKALWHEGCTSRRHGSRSRIAWKPRNATLDAGTTFSAAKVESPIISTRGLASTAAGTGSVAASGTPVKEPVTSTTRSVPALEKYDSPRVEIAVIAAL